MLSALRAAVTAGASTADPALPGMSRARGLRLGRPAAVSSSGGSASASFAASHPSSAAVAKSAGVGSGTRTGGVSTASYVDRAAGMPGGIAAGTDDGPGGCAADGVGRAYGRGDDGVSAAPL